MSISDFRRCIKYADYFDTLFPRFSLDTIAANPKEMTSPIAVTILRNMMVFSLIS